MRTLLATTLAFIWLVSCAGSNDPGDAGHDATDGNGGDEGGHGDVDPGEGFALSVPSGARACTGFLNSDFWLDVFEEYAHQARVTFQPGTVLLPVDEDGFERDWIERIEVGPERTELAPAGPGVFSRTLEGNQQDGLYRYEYLQAFEGGGMTYDLVYQVAFRMQAGVPDQRVVTFDDAHLSTTYEFEESRFMLTGTFGTGGSHAYTTCRYDLYQEVPHTITVENGDAIRLEQRYQRIDICKICPSALASATFERDGERREVDDFFRLAYTAGQHNWFQKFLVVFDEPVSGVHGFLIDEADTGQAAGQVQYLGAELAVTDTAAITDYQQEW